MYLHIGKDEMIKRENILFLLDYNGLKENKLFQEFFDNIAKEDRTDISKGNPKTVIIAKEGKTTKAYISNISATTLANRS